MSPILLRRNMQHANTQRCNRKRNILQRYLAQQYPRICQAETHQDKSIEVRTVIKGIKVWLFEVRQLNGIFKVNTEHFQYYIRKKGNEILAVKIRQQAEGYDSQCKGNGRNHHDDGKAEHNSQSIYGFGTHTTVCMERLSIFENIKIGVSSNCPKK